MIAEPARSPWRTTEKSSVVVSSSSSLGIGVFQVGDRHSPPVTLGPLGDKQLVAACTKDRADPVKPMTYRGIMRIFCAYLYT